MMAVSNWQIGQRVPYERPRGLFGRLYDEPLWFGLTTHAHQEAAAEAMLEEGGVTAFYPTELAWRRAGRSRRQRVQYQRKIAPGYILACFPGEPQWDRLFDAAPGRWRLRGVIGVGGRPFAIPEQRIAEMESLPERLAEMRARALEERRVRTGDRVRVDVGPFEGWVVDVAKVEDGIAGLMVSLLGQDMVSVPVQHLTRVTK